MRKSEPLTTARLAKRLGCSVRTVRRAIAKGRLMVYHAGPTYIIDEASVKGWKPQAKAGRPKGS